METTVKNEYEIRIEQLHEETVAGIRMTRPGPERVSMSVATDAEIETAVATACEQLFWSDRRREESETVREPYSDEEARAIVAAARLRFLDWPPGCAKALSRLDDPFEAAVADGALPCPFVELGEEQIAEVRRGCAAWAPVRIVGYDPDEGDHEGAPLAFRVGGSLVVSRVRWSPAAGATVSAVARLSDDVPPGWARTDRPVEAGTRYHLRAVQALAMCSEGGAAAR